MTRLRLRHGASSESDSKSNLRRSSPTRIDDKGRLKIPTLFRGLIQDQRGPDVFVTSVTGESVRIYPMSVWLEVEQRLSKMPANHPSRLKFLDRVSYYGQESELDGQGRIVVPSLLRASASIVGDVRVFGKIDYLEVWNDERFAQKLARDQWTDDDGLKLSEHGI
ncbi:MAG: division/cell wall cluster transcriptional repressor MraZ [Acidobacteria bacterium]|nr:MAG: division/cell wall cluster transcriptional repressor MraZ [Acidobacteriota bacterium]